MVRVGEFFGLFIAEVFRVKLSKRGLKTDPLLLRSLSSFYNSSECFLCPEDAGDEDDISSQLFTNIAVHCPDAGVTRSSCDVRDDSGANDRGTDNDTNKSAEAASSGKDGINAGAKTAVVLLMMAIIATVAFVLGRTSGKRSQQQQQQSQPTEAADTPEHMVNASIS